MKSVEIETRPARTILVIGYGNTLRGDDGAGVRLAARLATLWRSQGIPVTLRTVQQLTPELALEIASPFVQAVVFVDATISFSAQPIQVQRLTNATGASCLGHQMDPRALLTYASLLYGYSAPAWLVCVPGRDFEHGDRISSQVERLLDNSGEIAQMLAQAIETTQAERE